MKSSAHKCDYHKSIELYKYRIRLKYEIRTCSCSEEEHIIDRYYYDRDVGMNHFHAFGMYNSNRQAALTSLSVDQVHGPITTVALDCDNALLTVVLSLGRRIAIRSYDRHVGTIASFGDDLL